jgi:hypothetical protein
MTKILLFIAGLSTGLILGFSLAAWALYEPVSVGPAKYTFTRSPGPVPPYTMDGSRKLFRIECVSESAKDCPQPTAIPAPGTVWLLLMGLGGMIAQQKTRRAGMEPHPAGLCAGASRLITMFNLARRNLHD